MYDQQQHAVMHSITQTLAEATTEVKVVFCAAAPTVLFA